MAQYLYFPYKLDLTEERWLAYHGYNSGGILRGLELEKVDDTTVKIKKGVFYIVAANDSTKIYRVVLTDDVQVTVSTTAPGVYATLSYSASPDIEVQFYNAASAANAADLAIGKAIYNTSSEIIAFDYSERVEIEIDDKIRRGVHANFLVNGSFEDWYYDASNSLVPVAWSGTATKTTGYFSKVAANLAAGSNALEQRISSIYISEGKELWLSALVKGTGIMQLIFYSSTSGELYRVEKSITAVNFERRYVGATIGNEVDYVVAKFVSDTSNALTIDNVVVANHIPASAWVVQEEVASENIEFLYFDQTNTPQEAVVSNSPVVVFPSASVATAYFSFTYPSKFRTGVNIILKLLTSNKTSGQSGAAHFSFEYTIIEDGVSINQTSQTTTADITYNGTQALKTSGIKLPTASISKNAIINVKITRDPNDSNDTLDDDVYLFGIQLTEGDAS